MTKRKPKAPKLDRRSYDYGWNAGFKRGREAAPEEAAKTVEAFHHNSADGLDYETSGTQDKVAIYGNGTVKRAAAAVRALKRVRR